MTYTSLFRVAGFASAAFAILTGCGGSPSLPGAQSATKARHAPPPVTTSIIYRFRGSAHGAFPWGSLLYNNGALYGTTTGGGLGSGGGYGTVFKMTTSGQISTIYSFKGGSSDGSGPEADGLIADSNGDLFGTTNYGGASIACSYYTGCGTVFELMPHGSGYTEKVLYAFKGGADGEIPVSGVTLGSDGSLYGTTAFGGGSYACTTGSGLAGCGTVFKLAPSGSGYSESVIHSFQAGSDGNRPIGKLLTDDSGALYGTTLYGGGASACSTSSGNLGCGMVFRLTPSGSTYNETILYDFQGGSNGYNPRAGLFALSGGALIGLTVRGGSVGDHNTGTVYKLSPSGSGYTESVVFSFGGTAGIGPSDENGLIADGSGNLFGTTVNGGEVSKHNKCDCGTVFELSPSGSGYSETVLYAFKGTRNRDGVNPHASLTMDPSGTLYGVTVQGGLYNKNHAEGTVFKVML